MLFKLTKQTYLAIIHMQLLLIAILAKLKYGLQGKTISTIGKKTFFNYYKDKLLKDF